MTVLTVLGWLCAVTAAGVAGVAAARLRAQSAGVARAAHELRGGLCVAGLALERVSEDARVPVQAQLLRAGRALDALDRVVVPACERLELGALLRAVCAAWPTVALDLPRAPILIQGDGPSLTQAYANLVANAVEHGGPPVRVSAGVADGLARVEVADGGPGLPAAPAVLARRGRRSHARHGHGLAIASDAVERHGGTLAGAPSPAGARVVVELPTLES